MQITGEYFCGEVKYQIKGKLQDARSCHCSRCRKAFSSQASAYALVDHTVFEWVAGNELLTTYASQHGFGLQFCSKCGSTICGVYNGAVHGVTLGCLNGNPEVEIGRQIFVGSKADWEVLPEGIVQYQENVPENALQGHRVRSLCSQDAQKQVSPRAPLMAALFARQAVLENGKVRYEFKTPYNDGTTHVLFGPLDFMYRM